MSVSPKDRRERARALKDKFKCNTKLNAQEEAELDQMRWPQDMTLALTFAARHFNVSKPIEVDLKRMISPYFCRLEILSKSSIEYREWYTPLAEFTHWNVARDIEVILGEANLKSSDDFERELTWAKEYWYSDDLNLLDFLIRKAETAHKPNLIELEQRIRSVFDGQDPIVPVLTRQPEEVWDNRRPHNYKDVHLIKAKVGLVRGPCVHCRHSNQVTSDAQMGFVKCEFGSDGSRNKRCNIRLIDINHQKTNYYLFEPYDGKNSTWFVVKPLKIETLDGRNSVELNLPRKDELDSDELKESNEDYYGITKMRILLNGIQDTVSNNHFRKTLERSIGRCGKFFELNQKNSDFQSGIEINFWDLAIWIKGTTTQIKCEESDLSEIIKLKESVLKLLCKITPFVNEKLLNSSREILREFLCMPHLEKMSRSPPDNSFKDFPKLAEELDSLWFQNETKHIELLNRKLATLKDADPWELAAHCANAILAMGATDDSSVMQ